MFPYSSNPYPSFLPSSSSSSSSSLLPFPFLNPENASSTHHNINLLHDPLISLPYIPSHHHHHHQHNIPIPETLNNLALSSDNNNNNCGVPMPKHDPSSSVGVGVGVGVVGGASNNYGISCLLTKKPAKKDRHSKIYTSQGLRDRRVRLSIEIARKFFDLQDMLGFDKASNTLDWLFTKSKKAIKELAKSKNNNNDNSEGDGGTKSFTSSSECEDCEVVSDTPNFQQQQQQQVLLDGDGGGGGGGDLAKERKLKRAQKEPACVRANKMKESREKARARARERTSNKICSNINNTITGRVQQLELKKKYPAANENPQVFHQSRSQLQHDQDCVRSPNNKLVQVQSHPHHHLVGGEAQRDDFNVIEESIVIKRKLKPSLMVSHHHHHHHQNLVAPKETSFNNSDYHSFPNSSPNWDANNGNPNGRSTFCAIASMNLSTGLQIFGKSWEECTNPRLH